MSGDLGPRTMKRLGILAASIIAAAVSVFAFFALRSPSREEELQAFLGPGRILESVSGRDGLDGYYWARFECDPNVVREFIERHSLPSRANAKQRIDERYLNPSFDWPKNMEIFQADWFEFRTGQGNYIIIAFPADSTREVLFFEYDV